MIFLLFFNAQSAFTLSEVARWFHAEEPQTQAARASARGKRLS